MYVENTNNEKRISEVGKWTESGCSLCSKKTEISNRSKNHIPTSTGVASTRRYWMASTKMPGFDLANPTAHIACSSPLYSGHCPSLKWINHLKH